MNFQMSVLYVPISVVRTTGIKMCAAASGFGTYIPVIRLQLSALLYHLNRLCGPLLSALFPSFAFHFLQAVDGEQRDIARSRLGYDVILSGIGLDFQVTECYK